MVEANQDTSQPTQTAAPIDTGGAFDSPVESSTNSNLTVEDAFFGNTDDSGQAIEAPNSQDPSPQSQEIPLTDNAYQAKNDEKRFEYWQSQASQRENELNQLKTQAEQQGAASPPVAPQAQVPAQQAQVEEFPPAPLKPGKPTGYSREEAWQDASSESAKYLDAVEGWQEDIGQYNELKHQYDMAVMQEKFETIEAEKAQQTRVMEAQKQQSRQAHEISEYVQGHHGFSGEEAQDFLSTMASPDSISMDNLVALYRMNKGGGVAPIANQPSADFQQTRQAQQIPSPMGVMPATGTSGRSDGDQIMDSLIGDFNSNNPWK